MTTPHATPPRLPTGTFIVRDSDDERAISELLARHRVEAGPAPSADGAALRGQLRTAEHRLHELEATYEQTQELLGRAVADLEAERAARRDQDDQKYSRLIEAETDLAHAQRRVDDLADELEKARAAAAQPTPIGTATTAAREQDRAAFAELADRLDREALAQPKATSDVLRLSARAVRDEITAVYDAGRAAS